MTTWTAFLLGAAAATLAAAVFFLWLRKRRRRESRLVDDRLRQLEERASAAEASARQADARAVQADASARERSEAGRLAGGLIHEIRNPLSTLSMNLQLLREDWAEAETPRERRALKRLDRLQSETDRLAGILDRFMKFVREQRLDPVRCDLNTVVDDVATFMRPDLESKQIELRTSYADTPPCDLDIDLFKQALLNLVLNAEDAVAQSATKEIMIRTAAEDGGIRIEVIDTGKGIAPEDMGKIFDAFYSTRKGGTGLGLPAARRVIEQHGGTITVHSDHERGTSFTLRLPAAEPEPSPEKADDANA